VIVLHVRSAHQALVEPVLACHPHPQRPPSTSADATHSALVAVQVYAHPKRLEESLEFQRYQGSHRATSKRYSPEGELLSIALFILTLFFHCETLSVVRPPLVGLVANHDAEFLYRNYCAPYSCTRPEPSHSCLITLCSQRLRCRCL
jgi:hypothetical protein